MLLHGCDECEWVFFDPPAPKLRQAGRVPLSDLRSAAGELSCGDKSVRLRVNGVLLCGPQPASLWAAPTVCREFSALSRLECPAPHTAD